ncbi:cobaltochelatase subunit CobN [Motiliproteus sp. MSK22-1]|uniref:cobaltochelatase subunit CobN n=1 Tax=Motiliproteus sp. MSK22-1 TaxID=1897630 RepID=UPI000975F588|nr:cobaltochelatase subunit CobN [Motiliproteus sp. MSK22-1]OMH33551.1 cobaltochelatase subunit CobN [Motiliproteus sp. MSK22-1]
MHLLAAQPGGFVDEEGIIDLDQSPADIVVLAAADSLLAALAAGVNRQPGGVNGLPDGTEHCSDIRLANWMQLLKPAAFDLYEHKVLSHAKVVVVSLLGGQNYWQYGFERLQAWAKANGTDENGNKIERQLILVPGDDAPDPELFEACTVAAEDSRRVWRYLREGGVDNAQQLFRFLSTQYLNRGNTGSDSEWHEPRVLPRCSMYMPAYREHQSGQQQSGHSQSGLCSYAEWQQRWADNDAVIGKKSSNDKDSNDKNPNDSGMYAAPVCLLLFYRSHLQSANTAMFDELIVELEAQQLNPLPIAIASLKDAESLALVNALLEQSNAQLIINTTGFASNTVASPDLSSEPTEFYSPFVRPIPVLQLVLSSSTEADWEQHSQGLRSRDIAMQVVLPEMDGRIHTRAVSFKAESYFDERCQISVVRYALHTERARFVAQLARRHCSLSSKTNKDKRIALILANYPTKDGRIGNGVGLDTPASTINILKAMEQAGYPVTNIPESGDALIAELLGAVTNNPNTLHQLPCWQSLSVEEYLQDFRQLPDSCQQAVYNQWGAPEEDIKYRDGRLMLSGIRLGETFVGIQPARGFNIDLVANYHDPDLIPPHNYLAFYFWLRHCYQVDAVIHVGKHGNLEWLPGKGSALSSSCWPDIALGPMPHFYPFIVNDPGEGAQAKRRTQAVIIDHLMPPMTRAESYGELAELETLVDEYYQALGMDVRREQWLREEILKQVRSSNVLDELTAAGQQDGEETADKQAIDDQAIDEKLLEDLDAYLCDIKEAQIRHGLHILGALPETEKLSDTLVALLRLPRGREGSEQDASSQGILHNLVTDLDLRVDGELFDPLDANHEPWTGNRPEVLTAVSDDLWRSQADTRERLELLAIDWVCRYVLTDSALVGIELDDPIETGLSSTKYPKTSEQLLYARNSIRRALEQSVELEIASLLDGLKGVFVPPGPSGAPTRGRLDTLPTGRNFFSVDNRSIPSPAAWAIGERSAQALLQRHLQEQGDYPKQLGLSVWGTATMRTGGDDIAQAFALMGVRPIWAPGSNRVVDFEVLSCQQLGRPRVDVTLRVSGFFRDAFPNVMKLYDAAVQAIAALEEPGNGNTIKANIQARQQQLVDQGMAIEEAERQASFRVFGSKPGAYGAGLQGLIDERCWEQQSDLAEAYLNWGGYAYGRQLGGNQQGDGIEAKGAFQHQLSQLEAVVQNQDNREHDILDSDDYYQFQGGMTNAVTVYSGEAPEVYHNDHSNPAVPKVRTLKEELNRVIRSRVLNPKWITAMREHGYKGAFEMTASVDYMFAYDATTNLIADYQYQKVSDALVFDPENRAFLEQHNPHALEEMAERLLEATQRGLWQDPGEYAEALQDLLLDIDQQQESAI